MFKPGDLIAVPSPVFPDQLTIERVQPDGVTSVALEYIDARNHTLGSEFGMQFGGRPVPIPPEARPCPPEWAEMALESERKRKRRRFQR